MINIASLHFLLSQFLLHFICTCTHDRAAINSASLFGHYFSATTILNFHYSLPTPLPHIEFRDSGLESTDLKDLTNFALLCDIETFASSSSNHNNIITPQQKWRANYSPHYYSPSPSPQLSPQRYPSKPPFLYLKTPPPIFHSTAHPTPSTRAQTTAGPPPSSSKTAQEYAPNTHT